MTSESVDCTRLNADFAAMQAQLAVQFQADGIAAMDVTFGRAGDLRYVGQEYELRVPFPPGPLDDAALAQVFATFEHVHKVQYGHVFAHSPIEMVPVFCEGQLIAFACTTAHHLDIGALSPGSCGIVDALDAYAEGLQFKAIKVYERGRKIKPVWQLLRDNIRVSDLVVGDMEAQVAAARIGAERLEALVRQYGLATFQAACATVMDYAERLMRQAIARVPDGTYSATTYIDGFLDDPNPRRRDLPIKATVTVAGDEITVDLTGTADQVPDRPINMPLEGTVDVAIWLTIRSVLLDTAVHGHIPVNDGLLRPIKIVAPKGCLANPIFPAPTIARFCLGNQLADTVMKALGQAVLQHISAGIGNLKVIAFSETQAGRQWVHMEIFEGSGNGAASCLTPAVRPYGDRRGTAR
jgi:N-methylhydantoinase B